VLLKSQFGKKVSLRLRCMPVLCDELNQLIKAGRFSYCNQNAVLYLIAQHVNY